MEGVPDTLSNNECTLPWESRGTGLDRRRLVFQPKPAEQNISHSNSCVCSLSGQQRICQRTFQSHLLETNCLELSSGLSPPALNVSAVICNRPQEGDSRMPQPRPPSGPALYSEANSQRPHLIESSFGLRLHLKTSNFKSPSPEKHPSNFWKTYMYP